MERTPAELTRLHVRNMRIMAIAFLAWSAVVIIVSERVIPPDATGADPPLPMICGVMAGVAAAGALLLRWKAVPAARRVILRGDIAVRFAWMMAYMGGLGLSQVVVLAGVLLRFEGTPITRVLPYYFGGVLLMLLFFPQPIEPPLDAFHS